MTKRILIIDDEPLVGRLLRRALKGNSVTHVHSAEAGLQQISSEPYDLVLCDLSMPQMSGMELYDNVAARSAEMVDRIVFMTGGAFTTEAVRFIERIPNETLDKPFDLARLRELVSEIQCKSESVSDGDEPPTTPVPPTPPPTPVNQTRPRARPLARANQKNDAEARCATPLRRLSAV